MSRLGQLWHENWLLILVLGALAIAFMVLRTRPTEVASVEAFTNSLREGQPTVVEFYSNA